MNQTDVHRKPSKHWACRQPFYGHQLADMANFRRNGMSAGLDGVSKVLNFGPFDSNADVNGSNLSKSYADTCRLVPEWFFRHIMKVGVGNPIVETTDDGVELTHSDLTNAVNAWRLWTYMYPNPPRTIVEIGGGFGCLASMMLRMWPDSRYIGVDLEQSLDLQRYYLGEHALMDRVELMQDMPEGIEADLVVNIRSFMEMNDAQLAYYFDWINRQRPGTFFYCVNAYKKATELKTYPFGNYWHVIVKINMIGQGNLCELILYRNENEVEAAAA